MKEPKPHVSPITEPKFAELSAGGKYIEGKPLPMKDGNTYWVEVICDKDGKTMCRSEK